MNIIDEDSKSGPSGLTPPSIEAVMLGSPGSLTQLGSNHPFWSQDYPIRVSEPQYWVGMGSGGL